MSLLLQKLTDLIRPKVPHKSGSFKLIISGLCDCGAIGNISVFWIVDVWDK